MLNLNQTNPDQIIHVIVSKEEAEVLTSLGIQGSWETGFWGTLEFFGYRNEGMPVGTTSLIKGYYYQWDADSNEWKIRKEEVLTLIR